MQIRPYIVQHFLIKDKSSEKSWLSILNISNWDTTRRRGRLTTAPRAITISKHHVKFAIIIWKEEP